MRKLPALFSLVFLISSLAFVLQPVQAFASPPDSSQPDIQSIRARDLNDICQPLATDSEALLSRQVGSHSNLLDFVASTARADSTTVVGVFVCRVLALWVVQQPANDPVFVSDVSGTATQFNLAAQFGTIGLLAHGERSGSQFFELAVGQMVYVVYGDGSVQPYRVSEVRHMRSLNPDNPYSDFLDLDHDGAQLSSVQVFNQVYAKSDRIVFQTCIERDSSAAWGRLFVTATRVFEDVN